MSLTMISSNIAGYTKKQLTAAVVFIGFCIGNAVGPQTFKTNEARQYSFPLHPAYCSLFFVLSINESSS
jgi:hypothetical protein